MMLSGPWSLLDLKDAKLDYGVADLPGFNGDHQTVSGPDLWVLFDHEDANRAGAARDFIKWLTSTEIDAKWNLALGNLPLRTSEQDTPEFADVHQGVPGRPEVLRQPGQRQAGPARRCRGYDGAVAQRRRRDRQGAAGRGHRQGGSGRGGARSPPTRWRTADGAHVRGRPPRTASAKPRRPGDAAGPRAGGACAAASPAGRSPGRPR